MHLKSSFNVQCCNVQRYGRRHWHHFTHRICFRIRCLCDVNKLTFCTVLHWLIAVHLHFICNTILCGTFEKVLSAKMICNLFSDFCCSWCPCVDDRKVWLCFFRVVQVIDELLLMVKHFLVAPIFEPKRQLCGKDICFETIIDIHLFVGKYNKIWFKWFSFRNEEETNNIHF